MAAENLAKILSGVKPFSTLDPQERVEIASLFRPFRAEAGQILSAEGAPADRVYVFTEGLALVTLRAPGEDMVLTSECRAGDVLGELALNSSTSRAATVTAEDRTEGYTLAIDDFDALRRDFRPAARKVLHDLSRLLAERLRRMSRQISGNAGLVEGDGFTDSGGKARALDAFGPPSASSEDVRAFLRILPFFKHFDDDELHALTGSLREWRVPRGGIIFEEGTLGSSAFVVVSGAVEVSQRSTTRRVHLSVAGPGTTVGMVPLVDRGPRRTTCAARENVVLLELDAHAFDELVSSDERIGQKLASALNTNLIESLRQAHAQLVRRATHADFDRTAQSRTSAPLKPTLAAAGLPASALIDLAKPGERGPSSEPADSRWEQFHIDALIERIRRSVIGDDAVIGGPFGFRRIVYADYTASGRSLSFIEDFIRREVLPLYANTHTESSGTGFATSRLREDARDIIHASVGGGPDDVVIFCGSGATGAIDKLSHILGLRIPRELDARYGLSSRIPKEERPVVFIGPYEHHSNELVWRESIADVITIREDDDGRIDLAHLEEELQRYQARPLKIGSFSAASNVTGIISDDVAITALLHRYSALSFWDYAAAGPYLRIRMNPDNGKDHEDGRLASKDAVFISPHKFIGGPGTPGVLVLKKCVYHSRIPTMPGGGTVQWVSPEAVRYLDDIVHREEAGTPAIIESIRAGLVFQLKEAVRPETIRALEEGFIKRAIASFAENENLWVLGNPTLDRLSIVSLVVRHGERALHWSYVVTLLNDLFGIQARGGCSCAGPYGHRLLAISPEASCALGDVVESGFSGIRPGWFRVSFNYFISEATFQYILEAIHMIAREGYKLLPQYDFDPKSGNFTHVAGRPEPPLRLKDVAYLGGELDFRTMRAVEPESALPRYLEEARQIFAAASSFEHKSIRTDVPDRFESMRWFLTPEEAATELAAEARRV